MLHVWYVYLHLGFLGQMLVNIPYMGHMGMLAHLLRILMETSCHICFSFVSSSHAFLGIEKQKTSGNKPLDVQMLQLPYSDFFERVINAGFQQIRTLATTFFAAAPFVRARLRHDLGSKGLS
jgi:hypothetical protein